MDMLTSRLSAWGTTSQVVISWKAALIFSEVKCIGVTSKVRQGYIYITTDCWLSASTQDTVNQNYFMKHHVIQLCQTLAQDVDSYKSHSWQLPLPVCVSTNVCDQNTEPQVALICSSSTIGV